MAAAKTEAEKKAQKAAYMKEYWKKKKAEAKVSGKPYRKSKAKRPLTDEEKRERQRAHNRNYQARKRAERSGKPAPSKSKAPRRAGESKSEHTKRVMNLKGEYPCKRGCDYVADTPIHLSHHHRKEHPHGAPVEARPSTPAEFVRATKKTIKQRERAAAQPFRFCTNCGLPRRDAGRFCGHCGVEFG